MFNFKKKYFYYFILIFILIGSIASFYTGISHDEMHEHNNWEYNKVIVSNMFNAISSEINYIDKYYGIGFHFLSQPFQKIIEIFSISNKDISNYGISLLSKHPITFIFFVFSGLFFYKILNKITNNESFSFLGTVFYLLYPYLLGHSFINAKDIPFLTCWLICTFYSCNILNNYVLSKKIFIKQIFLLSFLTAFLLSIRISGILIFLQYFISFIILLSLLNFNNKDLIFLLKKILLFSLISVALLIIFYPIAWTNPFEIINAIKFMSDHHNDVSTLTLGKYVKSKNIDSNYILIWMLFKLPLIILVGLFLVPFTEKKILSNNKNKIFFGTLLLSPIVIVSLLILRKVPLYDELRQILFLVPILLLIGLSTIFYFFKNQYKIIISTFIIFFVLENFYVYPYQYTWFNLPSRLMNLEKNFELDYWGISNRNLANKLIKNEEMNSNCVITSPIDTIKPFFNNSSFTCFKPWGAINSDLSRPFYAIQTGRNLRSSLGYKCKVINEEKIKFFFYNKDLTAGNLIKCQ